MTGRYTLPALVAALLFSGTTLAAQDGSVSAAVVRDVGRARAMVEAGNGADARALLDSLVRAQQPGGNDLAEALYWRATLAERATDAERDWKRLTIESPLSPRAADALVRLGEFETLRGRPAMARPYFDRVVKDFPNTPQRAKSTLWTVRGWFDERNAEQACAALSTLPAASVPDGELRLQYDELGRRCTPKGALTPKGANTPKSADTPKSANELKGANEPKSANATAEGDARYSVQLAAFDTRAEAEASVKRLVARDIAARVDGDAKPFRVRVGRYKTRAEAVAALAKLKKQGQSGFIAELMP
jgi:cell division septation protein DedD